MVQYWLTPVKLKEPVTIGADRICCIQLEELEDFRHKASLQHARLLPLFKADLLLSDDEDACGSEWEALKLSEEGCIVFDGNLLTLSHCAEAFLDRMLDTKVTQSLVETLLENSSAASVQSIWLHKWLEWLNKGYAVMLLREDGI
ncbi:hypothetical protein [Paenibacillus hexagrammi]|uniref:Uncharacterized protein n=1 Tax=Paenibacillus hexagrammi TaxID=2908839 RepID=A0ABY3SPQ9_9BACL|nr:hypothetical protein [Paenibacillus sp. YPD9-1]UJF35110.1 hypothetical protein L0M14_08235 [Paenibacillus sp. YPD9-1]